MKKCLFVHLNKFSQTDAETTLVIKFNSIIIGGRELKFLLLVVVLRHKKYLIHHTKKSDKYDIFSARSRLLIYFELFARFLDLFI